MQNNSAKNTLLDMDKWQEIVDAWSISGEPQKTYCQRLGLNKNTFSYARCKLNRKKEAKNRFIPVIVNTKSEEKISSRCCDVTIENPQGYKLHLSASLSLEHLAKLFKLAGWQDA